MPMMLDHFSNIAGIDLLSAGGTTKEFPLLLKGRFGQDSQAGLLNIFSHTLPINMTRDRFQMQ